MSIGSREIDTYLAHPDEDAIRQTGRRLALDREIALPEDADAGPIGRAVQAGDYRAFRIAMAAYEEWLRKRVGRWVQRFPDAEERIGRDIFIGDLIEEVYLRAFEEYAAPADGAALSDWLDKLIDPALQETVRKPADTHEEASLAPPCGRRRCDRFLFTFSGRLPWDGHHARPTAGGR